MSRRDATKAKVRARAWRPVARALILAAASAAHAQSGVVAPELWDRPRSGAAVVADPAVRDAAARMVARPAAKLVIRHPRTADALLQAEELRAWLVAYAIDAKRIELRGDGEPKQGIVLEVLP